MKSDASLRAAALALGWSFALAPIASAQCVPHWVQTARMIDVGGNARVIATLDVGGVPQLIAAGDFLQTRDGPASHVARYDGLTWHAMGDGLPVAPASLVSDGSHLYAALAGCPGSLATSNLWISDGGSWTQLPAWSASIRKLEVLGGVLYAIADPCDAATTKHALYRYDTDAWNPVGPAIPASAVVNDAIEYNSGLVVCGSDLSATATTASIARLDSAALIPLGSGVRGGAVSSMALRAGNLVVAGSFLGDIINPLAKFAVWNGSAWTALTPNPAPPEAADLEADIDPAGADLLFRWTRFNGVSVLGSAGLIRGDFVLRFMNDQPLQQAAAPATFAPVGVLVPIVNAAGTLGSEAHIFSIGDGSLTPLNDDHVVRPYAFSTFGGHAVAFESLDVDPVTQHTLVFQRVADQWVALGELEFPVAEAREFQGSLFAMGPGIYPAFHAARWDGSQWHDVGAGLPYMRPALDIVAGRLLLTGALLSSTGTWIGHPLPKHWDGSGWVEETTSALGARTTLDSDGTRILALSTVNLTTGALLLFDGSRLTSIGSHPLAGANYAAALLFHGEPFVVFKVPGQQPFNVISRRHAGVWETNRQDTVTTGLFIHRDTLYTDSGLRWDGAAWIPDPTFPAPGKNNMLARLAPTASVNGDLWIAGNLLERGNVVSAGSILSTCNCKADLTGDSVQELDDYFAFFNAWDVGAGLADVNFDGLVDLGDFFFFFETWDQGCGY